MKQLFLFAAFALYSVHGFSQGYKLDELRTYYWDGPTAAWEQDETRVYDYANGGAKETQITGLDFPSSENYYRIIKDYNDNNDISVTTNQLWDPNFMGWDTFSQITYDYNASEQLTSETTQVYDNATSTYMNESRSLYEYAGSLLMRTTTQEWNESTTAWVDDDKVEMTYTDGLLTGQISSSWSVPNAEWYAHYRDIVTYNVSGQLTEWLTEDYSYFDEVWVPENRSIPTYTGQLQTEVLTQRWNEATSVWVNRTRQQNTYDGNDNKTVFLDETWKSSTSEWVFHYKEEMDYSLATPLGLNEPVAGHFNVYPNPVNDQLNLTFGASLLADHEAQLFAIDGRLIQTEKLTRGMQQFQLQVSDLQSGVYLLTIKGDQDRTYKFLKE